MRSVPPRGERRRRLSGAGDFGHNAALGVLRARDRFARLRERRFEAFPFGHGGRRIDGRAVEQREPVARDRRLRVALGGEFEHLCDFGTQARALDVERLDRGDYRLVRRAAPRNEGAIDWLLSCPRKDFFVSIDSESTDAL